MNLQKPEPPVRGDGNEIDLHSMFFTIQGEGPYAGFRSVFVRLAGCNLQCPGCDTEYTEGRETWKARHLAALVTDRARQNNARGCLVVITGGEPFRQNLAPLCEYLAHCGHFVQIETNGFFHPGKDMLGMIEARKVSVVISPKTTKIDPVVAQFAYCFKYVLDHRSVAEDGLPIQALGHPVKPGTTIARPPSGKPIYLNPFDAKDSEANEKNLLAVADSCKRFGYIMGVQMHKLAGLE